MGMLPEQFVDLEPFAEQWSVATMVGRYSRRLESTREQRRAFYDAVAVRFDDILDYLDQWPLEDLRGENLNLLRLALSVPHVGLSLDYQGEKEDEHAKFARHVHVTRELDSI